jgi:hypothetical protein
MNRNARERVQGEDGGVAEEDEAEVTGVRSPRDAGGHERGRVGDRQARHDVDREQ